MIKNWLILKGIFIEMGVIEIEYELNKNNVFTKSDEEPKFTGLNITFCSYKKLTIFTTSVDAENKWLVTTKLSTEH